jgi:hypothetical protein
MRLSATIKNNATAPITLNFTFLGNEAYIGRKIQDYINDYILLCLKQAHPVATFDTYKGKGSGKVNGISGYTAEWTFVDAGEPGKNDTAKIAIKNPSNVVILRAGGTINKGNHQAHN